jgi:hypothetical protein
LTRFDAFSVSLGQFSFQLHANRVTWENQPGAYSSIVKTVSERLGAVKPSEAATPGFPSPSDGSTPGAAPHAP